MPPATGNPNLRFSLAGLQAGMAGGVSMLLWLGISSLWYRHSIWSVPNLLASTFFGEAAFRSGFGSVTWSGLALQLFLCGVLGVLFGLLARGGNDRLLVLAFGVIYSVFWYYVLFFVVWKSLNPLVALYIPNRPMLAGHFVYGAMLGRYPACRDAMPPAVAEG